MAVATALVELRPRVEVAARLWSRTPELVRSERALFALQGCFPRFDAESTLLKIVALQALDSARAVPAVRWAVHVEAELARAGTAVGADLVEAIAAMPGLAPGDHRRALSLSSRFAHYFVDADRFPVFDAWNDAELARIAPSPSCSSGTYCDFAARFARVAAAIELPRSRKIGPYLWLASQYRAWRRNPRRSIQHAARALFESGDADLVSLEPFGEPREDCGSA